jgi:DNA uptake protein ComE-like DNA-binding protein
MQVNSSGLYSSVTRRKFVAGTAAFGLAAVLGTKMTLGQESSSTPTAAGTFGPGEATWTKYNLNTISNEQILGIPGAGDRMTREFAEYRPYTTIKQFRQEIGKYVDDDVVAGYEQYLFVPVDPNSADSETLQQLPGIDEDKASQLAGAAPFADDAAFLAAVSGLVTTEQSTLAATYLGSVASAETTWIKYNLNSMSEDQIRSIPGIGDQMVDEFNEYRPYSSIEQFREEIGKYVDDDVVAGYERYVFVPVVPNDADVSTLLQLPGFDEDKAKALVDARPYADSAAFLSAVGQQVTADQAALATAYLASS